MSASRRRRRASPAWEGRGIITVAAVPGRGLYVRHLGHPEGVDGVHRPTVPQPGAVPRPPARFEKNWLAAHLDDVDVVHVHGIPARCSAADLREAVDAVRGSGRPLVVTAYHLHDPSGAEEDQYAQRLELLARAADALVTLTPSAADELRARFGLESTVLPHPHVVDFVRMRRVRPPQRRGPALIGTHLGSLRMPGDPAAFAGALAEAAAGLPGTRLIVHLHEHLRDPDSSRYEPGTVNAIQRVTESVGGVVRASRPMTDSQLWDHLFSLDVSVVPPLYGSHSIWPEACHDLGTRLVLPAGSHAAAQRPCFTYPAAGGAGGSGSVAAPDVAGLRQALLAAQAQETPWRADPAARWKERVGIAESLRSLYERLIGLA